MKRLLTTAPGSASPTLTVTYDIDSHESELVLITHTVPTIGVPDVCNDSGRASQAPAQFDGPPSFGSL